MTQTWHLGWAFFSCLFFFSFFFSPSCRYKLSSELCSALEQDTYCSVATSAGYQGPAVQWKKSSYTHLAVELLNIIVHTEILSNLLLRENEVLEVVTDYDWHSLNHFGVQRNSRLLQWDPSSVEDRKKNKTFIIICSSQMHPLVESDLATVTNCQK